MESPYFTDHWARPSHRNYFHAPPSQIPKQRARSKVIEIPVQYVSSDTPNRSDAARSDAAVKIQKVFRGYFVRKSVKKIEEIRRDVAEIEKRVFEEERVEVIKNDVNERLRLNESLMSLLFKLDSVLGVDLSVREFRKRVIKRVIRLQEIVDEIASSEQSKGDVAGGEFKEDVKTVESDTEEAKLETESNAEMATDEDGADVAGGELREDVKTVETATEEPKLEAECNADVATDDAGADDAGGECRDEVAVSISEGFEQSLSQPESQTDSNPLIAEEEKDECEEREEMEVQKRDDVAENKRSRDLLERMVEDNEKMMGLMAELFERNEMQTRLLSALSQRVGQLEKAFMCERLRKKKKKNGSNGLVDCIESTKDHCNKKCGEKKD